jgi:hypothetical protein
MCKPFGELKVKNIETKPKKNNLFRNILIIISVLLILIKLLNGKGKKGDASLLRKLWMAIKGVKTIKK